MTLSNLELRWFLMSMIRCITKQSRKIFILVSWIKRTPIYAVVKEQNCVIAAKFAGTDMEGLRALMSDM
jgi:hypothetical protein